MLNDLSLFRDNGNCAILILLDLSAVFHTIDHAILLDCLKLEVGIQGTALNLFTSYFIERQNIFCKYWKLHLVCVNHLWGSSRLSPRAYLILVIYASLAMLMTLRCTFP